MSECDGRIRSTYCIETEDGMKHIVIICNNTFFSLNCINHKENCTRKRGISLYGMENPCSYVLPLVKH